ncbi:hypothetical protein BLNAU_6717 [Blattamonas nauphoetae]|uniref:Uncharacterized protein n=1 Tax=Blattamonas nauphoetae TaxID=2049346 RepID=A0ABQ9Y3B2_9EUKA|nr:hypothetical protein BLNAU_6717 [Blattamonas nauphoetae]
MNPIIHTTDASGASSSTTRSDLSSSQLSFSMDCSPFLDWNEEKLESEDQKAVIFQSLVATVKSQPAFDVSLEVKAVKFIESGNPDDEDSADAFLNIFGRTPDESSTNFIQSVVVLLSSPHQAITIATMKMLRTLIANCSDKVHLSLVKADLINQLIITLNPQSLSFTEAEDIHTCLISNISRSIWLATLDSLANLEIEGPDEQQAVHETVLKQVLEPSEKYICHLCVNRSSILDGEQSEEFMFLLARLLQISPYYQPTMVFVQNMPVALTIPSCLTFFETDPSIWHFFHIMKCFQEEWNEQGGNICPSWTEMLRSLRMEGFDDVTEQRLLNDLTGDYGEEIAGFSNWLNILLGMNIAELE